MEKRQRLALLVALTRYNRWLERRGVIRSSVVGDRLLAGYLKTLEEDQESKRTSDAI